MDGASGAVCAGWRAGACSDVGPGAGSSPNVCDVATGDEIDALEGTPEGLTPDESARLVVVGLASASPWWTSKALLWVEGGVWSPEVRAAVSTAAHDSRLPADLRRRAERLTRPQVFTATATTFNPPGEGYRWAHDVFWRVGWRYGLTAAVGLLAGSAWVFAAGDDPGGGGFLLVGGIAHALFAFFSFRGRDREGWRRSARRER